MSGRTALRLEERDLSLLCDLFAHGAMLRVQVQALHFPSLRRCNRRLRQMFLVGCVARMPVPLGTQAAWLSGQRGEIINEQVINNRAEAGFGSQHVFSSQYVYRLGPAGAQPVAQCLGWNEADVRRLLRPGSPLYLAHALEGVRFRLLLTQAVETGNVRLLRFLPERLLLHAYEVRETGRPGAPWRREVFKPDAFFEIALLAARPAIGAACEPYPSRFFVEIDLGHTSAREFANKVRIYRRYQGSGLFEKRYGGTGFRTLVCTTSPTRRDNLRRIVEGEGTDLFWLSTLADIANPGPFAPVWPPLQEMLDRHRRGDWGMVDDFEAEENNYAAEHGGMITSVYWLPIGSVAWISMEGDRSKTYVILPTYSERDGSRSIRDGSRS